MGLEQHRAARGKRGGGVAACHGEREGEVAGGEHHHRAQGHEHAPQVGPRCAHGPVGVGMVDAGVKVAAVAQHLSEEAQLEGGALELAAEPGLGQVGLAFGHREQLVRRCIQGVGDGVEQRGALGGAQGRERRGGRLRRGEQRFEFGVGGRRSTMAVVGRSRSCAVSFREAGSVVGSSVVCSFEGGEFADAHGRGRAGAWRRRTGFRRWAAAPGPAPRQAAAKPQTRPWHQPIPARVKDLRSAASRAPRLSRASVIWPAVTSSQRHTVVSGVSHSCQAAGTGWARCMASAKRRCRAARGRSGEARAARPAAAAAPAARPSSTARVAPPTPVTSPARNRPGTLDSWRSSTTPTREPSASSRVSAPRDSGQFHLRA